MYLSSFEMAFEALCARLRVIEVKNALLLYCKICQLFFLYNVIQASKVDTIPNFIVHKQMYLTNMC
jgi:hypothetical protein